MGLKKKKNVGREIWGILIAVTHNNNVAWGIEKKKNPRLRPFLGGKEGLVTRARVYYCGRASDENKNEDADILGCATNSSSHAGPHFLSLSLSLSCARRS